MRKLLTRLCSPHKPEHEVEFLPAALEIIATPPSPIGRGIGWTIMATFAFGIVWACIGKVDVVAVAQGRLIPSDQIKTIQLLEIGVIKHIAVSEGQRVRQGDLLIEMDTTTSTADIERLQQQQHKTRLELARISALLDWQPASLAAPALRAPEDMPATQIAAYAHRATEEARSYAAQLTGLDNDRERLKAQLRSAEHRVRKLSETLPIVSKRAAAHKKLHEADLASENDWLLREQDRIEVAQDLASEQQRLEEIRAGIRSLDDRKKRLEADFRQDLLKQQTEQATVLEQLLRDITKATQRNTLRRITAPVSGVVQQLTVHTVGGVIKEAEPIMVIVPENAVLEVETAFLNKDIGFIQQGQPAQVKLEAFPYTEYGSIAGTVRHVSLDAIHDEKRGLIFPGRVALAQSSIRVGEHQIPLTAGMNTTVEIILRKRRIIAFFLSPLLKYGSESLRER